MAVRVEEAQAPSQDDLLRLARRRFLHGEKVDIAGLATELGVSRATAYRWAGNVEEVTGAVFVSLYDDLLRRCVEEAQGTGAARLADIFARGVRAMASAPYRTWLHRQDPETALRIVASARGVIQGHTIRRWEELLTEEARTGNLRLPIDVHTMAYAIVRIGESFLYADLIVGEEPDVEKAIEVVRLLLLSAQPPNPGVG
jgi:AcrR family transcriptional regulator